jgi:hypothetical protein
MSEERVSNLAELYDRTKKCTGITIPKNCAIVIDIQSSSEFRRLYQNRNSIEDVIKDISILVVTLAGELMVAGIEEIFVIPASLPIDHSNDHLALVSLGKNLNGFRDSMRPNATIKIATNPDECPSGYGSFESAVIIEGPNFSSPREIDLEDDLLRLFLSPRTIVLNTFYCKGGTITSDRGRLMFSKEIISWDHGSYEKFKSFKCKTSLDDPSFALDSRVITQAVFMLCSNELAECFKAIPLSSDTMKIDGSLLAGIFKKFALQGFKTKELEGLDWPYFQKLIADMSEYGQWYRNNTLLSGEHRIHTIDREDDINFLPGSSWTEASSEWSAQEYSDLNSRETRMAHPELATSMPEDADGEPVEAAEPVNDAEPVGDVEAIPV